MRLAIALLFLLFSSASFAQSASPEGTFRDKFGTTVRFSYCGNGTQLCAVLLNIGGASRTTANLAFVNQRVVKANKTSARSWKGTVNFFGMKANGTITLVKPDTINVKGCRGILCQTLAFRRT